MVSMGGNAAAQVRHHPSEASRFKHYLRLLTHPRSRNNTAPRAGAPNCCGNFRKRWSRPHPHTLGAGRRSQQVINITPGGGGQGGGRSCAGLVVSVSVVLETPSFIVASNLAAHGNSEVRG